MTTSEDTENRRIFFYVMHVLIAISMEYLFCRLLLEKGHLED